MVKVLILNEKTGEDVSSWKIGMASNLTFTASKLFF
jgi:hypothetical protein